MDQTPDNPELVKLLGGFIGAFLSLTYIKPINIRDALLRGLFSTVSGYVFGFYIREQLGWAFTFEKVLASAALAGSISWVAAGVIIAVVGKRMQG